MLGKLRLFAVVAIAALVCCAPLVAFGQDEPPEIAPLVDPIPYVEVAITVLAGIVGAVLLGFFAVKLTKMGLRWFGWINPR